ncbi:MAG TPA: DUF4870 domain-containing protein [Terriglobales bacterium]|nr:DUF4870 domain-containing protein [Terriglobales bacterium]
MAFCKACGQELGGAAFCPKCGAAQGAAAPAAGGASAATTTSGTEGMAENVAGLLCYLFGWVSGLIFLLIDKRPFVKFHGAQSIALSLSFFVVWVVFWFVTVVLGFITAMMHFPIGFLMAFLFPVIIFAYFVIFIFCMYKAYQGEKFKLPIIGNLVEGMVK